MNYKIKTPIFIYNRHIVSQFVVVVVVVVVVVDVVVVVVVVAYLC